MIFDVRTHAALSGKALALEQENAPNFAQQVLLAEVLLNVGLNPLMPVSGFTEAQVSAVSLAIVLQVNYQLQFGVDPGVYAGDAAQKTPGSRSVAYKADAGVVSPYARQIMDDLANAADSGAWGPALTSIRGPRG